MRKIINLDKKEILQPELSYYDFYGVNELMMIDFNVYNKFVKKEAYIKALNTINKYSNLSFDN